MSDSGCMATADRTSACGACTLCMKPSSGLGGAQLRVPSGVLGHSCIKVRATSDNLHFCRDVAGNVPHPGLCHHPSLRRSGSLV